jgi:hypothetical protein
VGIDDIGLWALTIANTLGLLLVIRQLATLPQYTHTSGVRERKGPAVGTVIEDWSLAALEGGIRREQDLPPAYTLLFVASTCDPCHKLLAELRTVGRPASPLYLVANGDAQSVATEATTAGGPLFDELLITGSGDLYQRLDVPGTPYAVSIRDRRVVAAGVSPAAADVARIANAAGSVARRALGVS